MKKGLSIGGVAWALVAGALALAPVAHAQYNGVLVIGVPDFDDSASVNDSGAVSVLHTFQDTGVGTTFSQFFDQNSTDFQSVPHAVDSFGQSVVVGDFNGDIAPDIAIGIPWEDISGKSGAGMVQVVYGTFLGFLGYTEEALHHNVSGMEGDPCTRCQFGSALTVGDFNGDGYDDLAVGSPEYYVDSVGDPGAVNVVYGADGGISTVNDQLWTQDSTDILDDAYDGDYFGAALAAGDFDGDGYDDLAIGVPRETVGGGLLDEDGAVNVIYGSASGLAAARNQFWTQGDEIGDSPEDNDHFGAVLAVGDFDGNGYDDLVVSAPDEDLPGAGDTGVVHVISGWGAGLGLVEWNSELWSQSVSGMPDDAEEQDHFGAAVAAGDFDGDGYDDLAIGVPTEDLYEATPEFMYEAGAVHVLHGSSTMLEVGGNLSFVQGVPTVPGVASSYEHFGQALAAADLDGDGYADLVIGVPADNPDAVVDAGAVHVLYGSPDSVASYVNQYWHLDVPGVDGNNQEDAAFGSSLAATNFSLLFAYDFERGDSVGWSNY